MVNEEPRFRPGLSRRCPVRKRLRGRGVGKGLLFSRAARVADDVARGDRNAHVEELAVGVVVEEERGLPACRLDAANIARSHSRLQRRIAASFHTRTPAEPTTAQVMNRP